MGNLPQGWKAEGRSNLPEAVPPMRRCLWGSDPGSGSRGEPEQPLPAEAEGEGSTHSSAYYKDIKGPSLGRQQRSSCLQQHKILCK